MRPKRLLIFDVDGTLYQLPGGSFSASPLRERVERNAIRFISKRLGLSLKQSRLVLKNIRQEFGEDISLGLKQKFQVPLREYFQTVWDISTKSVVRQNNQLRPILLRLASEYNMVVVSDAPKIWIDKVLKTLHIETIFRKHIYSGDGKRRKGQKNTFTMIAKKLGYSPSACTVVGDQMKTDILPARDAGMNSVYIHPNKRSKDATYTIGSITELEHALRKKFSVLTKN